MFVVIFIHGFYYVEVVCFYSYSTECSYHERVLNLSVSFSASVFFILLMWHITLIDFCMLNHLCIPGCLLVVPHPFSVLLNPAASVWLSTLHQCSWGILVCSSLFLCLCLALISGLRWPQGRQKCSLFSRFFFFKFEKVWYYVLFNYQWSLRLQCFSLLGVSKLITLY